MVLKSIINDIIEVAYKGNPRIKQLKEFSIDYHGGSFRKTMNGIYKHSLKENNNTIDLYNDFRPNVIVFKTLLHETAHHCDYVINNGMGHQEGFYNEYAKLLYAALDMGFFELEEFFNEENDSADCKKVKKILEAYVPKRVDYMNGKEKVFVQNGYDYREVLKHKGFTFDNAAKGWGKIVDISEEDPLITFLDEQGIKYIRVQPTFFEFNSYKNIWAVSNTLKYKDVLKSENWYYEKKKKSWRKKVKTRDAVKTMKELQIKYPEITFCIVKD